VTRRQEYLLAIKLFTDRAGYAPSTRELCALLDLASTNAVAEVLAKLQADGLVERNPAVARSLRLTESGRAAIAEVLAHA